MKLLSHSLPDIKPTYSPNSVIDSCISVWLKQSLVERIEAERILCHVLGVPRSYLYAHGDETLNSTAIKQANALAERRQRGEPLAYLLGECEFWSLPLKVNKHVLIPRDDTGCLVNVAMQVLPTLPDNGVIVDAGTGSGAIAIALARETQLNVIAIERCAAALKVAAYNVARLAAQQVHCVQGDWLNAIAPQSVRLLLSNPPYIATDDPHLLAPELQCEPRQALVSGHDGLDDLRRLAQAATRVLLPGGVIAMEHGFEQGAQVRTLLLEAGLVDALTVQDLSTHERVTHARKP